jgi:hypothetical protein
MQPTTSAGDLFPGMRYRKETPEYSCSAGVFGFANARFKLSHSSIFAPFLCTITLCCSTESELFQAQLACRPD